MKMNFGFLTFGLALLIGAQTRAMAQGTAFTYQGHLNDSGQPANGVYDLKFSIYDALVSGGLQGNAITNASVGVTNGSFTVVLDFGNVFPKNQRWLELGVRTNGSPTDFSLLSPRQELTPVPYAITSENVEGPIQASQLTGTLPAGALSGIYAGGLTLNNSSNSFAGNGSGLTGVNAAGLNGLPATAFWKTGGNSGTSAVTNFLGTIDDIPLELDTYGYRGLHLEFTTRSSGVFPNIFFQDGINVIGGFWGNTISNNVIGGTISGGGDASGQLLQINGTSFSPNTVTGDFGTVGGGYNNTAGNAATVPGGYNNLASGIGSFAAGRNAKATNSGSFVWSDGVGGFASTANNQFLINASGGVGIGTTSPDSALEIASGDLQIDGHELFLTTNTSTNYGFGMGYRQGLPGIAAYGPFIYGYEGGALGAVGPTVIALSWDAAGNVNVSNNLSTATLSIRGGADLAEPFNITPAAEAVPEGSVLVIDEENPGKLKLSHHPYDRHVAGVISGANGINPGIQMQQQGLIEGGRNVALTGRVYVRADASNGAIKPGDLLTTSATPGHAMKVTRHSKAQGAILGKAMTGLEAGRGMVLVLVSLQ